MEDHQQSEQGTDEERFWQQQFAGGFPVLDLPTDRSRPALKTYSGGMVERTIGENTVSGLRKIAAKNQSSFFQLMLTGFSAYVSRISSQDEFIVTMPTAGQSALEQHELIGHCVNDLPLCFNVDAQQTKHQRQ